MESEQSQAAYTVRVTRTIELIIAHARDGSVTPREVASVMRLGRITDMGTGFRIRRALASAGVRIATVAACGDGTAADSPELTEQLPDAGAVAPPVPAADLSAAVTAASLLLAGDRRRGAERQAQVFLTAEQEVGLAVLMRGDEIALDQELPARYRRTLPDSDPRAAAFDAMILHNQRLVSSLAVGHQGLGLEPEDLMQSAQVGLIRAVEKFDATQGFKFSTYAANWIRQSMSRAVANEGRAIRVPVHVHERIRKVMAVRERLLTERGRARPDDIASEAGMTLDKVAECLRLAKGMVSIEKQVGDEDGTELGEFLADSGEHLWEDEDVREAVRAAVDDLPERQATVIRLRTGLAGGDPMTLEQVGQLLGVTRERVRQIEKKAMEVLSQRLHAVDR